MKISLALWNLRSIENVASILRTADGFGVQAVYFIGTTPYPTLKDASGRINDTRLPHIRALLDKKFAKTSLGAEQNFAENHAFHHDSFADLQRSLPPKTQIIALEQTPKSHVLPDLPKLQSEVLLVIGEERHGLPPEVLSQCNAAIEIPMRGCKESFNVAVATGIALYALAL